MDKKEKFKIFLREHAEIIDYVKRNNISMQSLFEIYDIYGEDMDVWNKYFDNSKRDTIGELTGILKNINLDNVEKYVNNAGKAIGILQELTKKNLDINIVREKNVDKYFGD